MSTLMSPDHVPANPLEKAGYRLDFHDEFRGAALDQTKWLPFYLPQWSSRERAAPHYALHNDTLILRITQDQQPWCPELDGYTRCSSLQTGVFSGPLGSTVGQHRFHRSCVVREPQPPRRTYTPQYGYFELRAKGVNTIPHMVTLWMIGYEDAPENSAEIAIMEIKGAGVSARGSLVGYGVHPWSDSAITDEFYEDVVPIDATQYHIYAVEWTPTAIDFYIDNEKRRTVHQSPAYPMQFMLGLYELGDQEYEAKRQAQAERYPIAFVVDYFRAYQPLAGYPEIA